MKFLLSIVSCISGRYILEIPCSLSVLLRNLMLFMLFKHSSLYPLVNSVLLNCLSCNQLRNRSPSCSTRISCILNNPFLCNSKTLQSSLGYLDSIHTRLKKLFKLIQPNNMHKSRFIWHPFDWKEQS